MAKSKSKSPDYSSLDIFIVDDSACHNVFLSNLLEHKGHRVTVFNNKYMLLNHFKSIKPDLIISDIEMPTINGLELYEKIREKEKKNNIPFFLRFLTSGRRGLKKYRYLSIRIFFEKTTEGGSLITSDIRSRF